MYKIGESLSKGWELLEFKCIKERERLIDFNRIKGVRNFVCFFKLYKG